MTRWLPCKRRLFVKRLRALGFMGPYAGSRHEFMVYGNLRLSIPSNEDYSVPQLRVMLREAELILDRAIDVDEWDSLG